MSSYSNQTFCAYTRGTTKKTAWTYHRFRRAPAGTCLSAFRRSRTKHARCRGRPTACPRSGCKPSLFGECRSCCKSSPLFTPENVLGDTFDLKVRSNVTLRFACCNVTIKSDSVRSNLDPRQEAATS